MSIVNNRSSSYVEGFITNIVKDDVNKEFNIEFATYFPDDTPESLRNIVFANSAGTISDALTPEGSVRQVYVSNLTFLDNDDPQEENTFLNTKVTVNTFNYLEYNDVRYLKIDCKWKPANYDDIESDFSFDNSHNLSTALSNTDVEYPHTIKFAKIGAPKPAGNSGRMSSSIKTIINRRSYDFGTLPSNKITTGKKLQSFNDPYIEKNLIEFKEVDNVHASLGVPLIKTNENDGFYITTDTSLSSPIDVNSNMYESQYDLKNSEVAGFIFSDENFDGQTTTRRVVTSKNLDALIKQERFQEDFVPFVESDYHYKEDLDLEFYSENLNKEDGEYNLGKQKQIKIVLDFSGDGEEYNNLHLMNTKFSFINPLSEPSNDTNLFLDNNNNANIVVDTQYFNFLKGTSQSSYSSHHMPTAYWNNKNNRWSYLDAGVEFGIDEYLGAKIPDTNIPQNTKTQVLNNFIFDNSGNFIVQDPNSFNSLYYSKPILTTPGFRNDGSFLVDNNSNQYNKSALCKITDTYGFPYKGNWQPTNDHLINMSDYIAKDFLLEKMIIKGKYTSKGEMPVKNGNFASGFSINSESLDDSSFLETYSYKDDHKDYISNSVTFFLLNEQENKNFINQKINVDTLQHYTYLLDQQNTASTFSSAIDFLPGEFKTSSSRLSVKSYQIEKNEIYTFNDYNILDVNLSKRNIPFSKSRFHYLASIEDENNTVESMYFRNILFDNSNYMDTIISNQNKIGHINLESNENFNINKSREIVTYSNLLLTKKLDNVDLDEKLLENIDLHKIETVQNEDDMHLNQDNPEEFVIQSFCKNNTVYSSYTDETELKIGSNYKTFNFNKLLSSGTSFTFDLGFENFQGNIVTFGSGNKVETILDTLTNYNYPVSDITTNNVLKLDLGLRDIQSGINRKFIEVRFTFTDPVEYYPNEKSAQDYQSYFNWDTNSDSSNRTHFSLVPVYMRDFVKVTHKQQAGNHYYNEVIINLRFLDIFPTGNIVNDFLSFNIHDPDISGSPLSIRNAIKNSITSKFFIINNLESYNDLDIDVRRKAFMLFVYNAIFNKAFYLREGGYINPFTYDPNNDTTEEDFIDLFDLIESEDTELKSSGDARITINEISGSEDSPKLFTFFDSSNNVIFNEHNVADKNNLTISSSSLGSLPVYEDLLLHNKKYILEGSTKGTNNIDIETNRIINKEFLSQNLVPEFESKSGKILHSGNSINQIVKSNYLLKPSDNLVFGVTSNCNGQAMPTVFKLHDKVEITLIGRDYVNKESKNYKNNESEAIRKVVYGDNFIEKTKYTIYDTKNAYYDNVWDKSSLINSKEEFLTKKVLKLNSSRENGTYSGLISLGEEFIELENNINKPVYIKDTIQPSLGKVFKDCLGMKTVLSKNHNDEIETKIIISENFENIDNSVNVINKWHKTYHLDEYASFFNNLYINSTTYPETFINNNVNVGIYYDAKTYNANPSIKEFNSSINSVFNDYNNSNFNNDEQKELKSELRRYCKSLKSFVLPSSLLKNYQNGIEIQNENTYDTWNNGQNITSKHVKSNKNIEKSPYLQSQHTVVEKSSLQYFDLKLRSLINISETNNIPLISDNSFNDYVEENFNLFKSINRNSLGEYINDVDDLNNNFELNNPQWHLVIEITFNQFKNMMSLTGITVNNQNISSFINRDINIFLHNYEYSNNEWLPNSDPAVSKVARVTNIIEGEEVVILAIPLYFWETLETVNARYFQDNFENQNDGAQFSKKINKSHKNNLKNNIESDIFNLKPVWYAQLSDVQGTSNNRQIKYLQDVYKPFVLDTRWIADSTYNYDLALKSYSVPPLVPLNHTYLDSAALINDYEDYLTTFPFSLPYRYDDLTINFSNFNDIVGNISSTVSESLQFNKGNRRFAITPSRFITNNGLSPVDENKSSNIEKLKNRYNLLNHTKYLTHRKYFENNQNKIDLRRFNGISSQEFDENLNEKVYRSKIYKKTINNDFVKTNYYLIYKVHEMYNYSNLSENDVVFTQYNIDKNSIEYNIIEIISIDSDYTLLQKHDITNDLLFGFENTDTIRIYEDELRKNNYFNNDFNLNTPYFEINLSAKTKTFSVGGVGFDNVYQIINASIGLDSNLDITQDQFTSFEHGDAGSLLFLIKDNNPNNYKNFKTQEDAIKSFFYGFSRGKNRFPITEINGFKFGVQSPVQQTAKHFYSNRRYGNLADKLLRTKNHVTAYRDNNGNNIFRYTVEKRFVNGLNYIDDSEIANLTNTFNKDIYARCSKPFTDPA